MATEVQHEELTSLLSEAKDKDKTRMTDFFQEFNGDGQGQHVELTNLLWEAKDNEKKHAAELFQEFNGDGKVQHEELPACCRRPRTWRRSK